ncbi:hypothetical protein XA68_17986 [Ophiocordyceps unilateralis]|uniref:Uncharacterized protein n=1 Tax=Ophiocordyceps unilateralis TaxID=268505 RepID=A0A2A9P3P8_OPHUN|nr:hypothetical protein XA68_17986 [Ophiocordyceps unilateralis]
MLVSLVVNFIQSEIRDQENVAGVYFYFGEGEKHRTSSRRKLNEPLQESNRLDSSDYLDLFKAQAATLRTVYLVMDGVDSCTNDAGDDMQQGIRAALRALPEGIRVLFTSRGDWVGREMEAHQKLSITPAKQDVAAYVRKRIEDEGDLRGLLVKVQDRKSVIDKVTAMAISSKMFLLARLHMDKLSKQGTLKDINTALSRLPDSASRVFAVAAQQLAEGISLEVDSFESRLATHILTWFRRPQQQGAALPGSPTWEAVAEAWSSSTRTKETLSLVHMVATADDAGLVKALVKGNARLDTRSTKGLSPLSSAIRCGPTWMAKAMIESQDDDMVTGPGADDGLAQQLRDAVRSHAHLLTDLLLKRVVDLNRPARDDGWTPLIHAAKTGDLSKLSLAAEAGAEPGQGQPAGSGQYGPRPGHASEAAGRGAGPAPTRCPPPPDVGYRQVDGYLEQPSVLLPIDGEHFLEEPPPYGYGNRYGGPYRTDEF